MRTRLILLAVSSFLAIPAGLLAQTPRTDTHGDPLPEGALFRFGSMQWRHGAGQYGIHNSALSPDGKLLATASGRSVAVWDLATGKRRHLFPCASDTLYLYFGLAFSPDGRRLGYVHYTEFACVWDLSTGKEIWRSKLDRKGANFFCHFSPDGKEFALGDRERTRFWDLASGKPSRELPAKDVCLLSPDGNTFVRVEWKKAVVFGDLRTGKEAGRWQAVARHNPLEKGIAFSPDGKSLAVIDDAKRVWVRDLNADRPRADFLLPDISPPEPMRREEWPWEHQVGFSGDGKTLLVGTAKGLVHRWDLASGKKLLTLDRHLGRVTGIHGLPDRQTLVTTGADGLIRFWDEKTGRPTREPDRYQGRAYAVCSPDGRLAAVGDSNGRVDLWDATTGKRLRRLIPHGPAVIRLAFAPDGRSLAAGLMSGEVRFWEVPSGRESKTLRWPEKRYWSFAHSLLFTPDGRYLYVSDYPSRTWLWEIATGKVVWRGGGECASALSPDGATLITAEAGPWVQVRDATTGKARARFRLNTAAPENLSNAVTAMAFSPDGRRLGVALDDGDVILCDARSGEEGKRFRAVDVRQGISEFARGIGNEVVSLAYSPDSRWLVTGGTDGSVRVWEAATGKEVWRRNGHEGNLIHVELGPGGRTALSSGRDGQAYLWDLRPAPDPKLSLDALWANLAGDAAKAYRAVWALSETKTAADFLRDKIAPVKPADPGRVAELIADLGSEQFKVRSEATRVLAELGELASPAMEAALKKKPVLEIEQRLRKLLEALKRQPSPAELQRMRAVQALELAGTPEAREVLRAWAGGAVGSRLTEDARAALARLAKGDVTERPMP